MKTIGVLLAGLLAASATLADETATEQDFNLTLAAQTPEAISWESDKSPAKPEMKIIDVDLTDQMQSIGAKISSKIDEKFSEKMQQELNF